MNSIKKCLLNLAIGEFAALCVFTFLYSQSNLGEASSIAFSYLVFILLQGSGYWFYRYASITRKKGNNARAAKLLRFLRLLNSLILVLIVIILPISKEGTKDLIIAIAIFLFGIIEYVNYYWYRLSYGKSGFNIKMLFSRGLQESSISKLINKYH